jgi:hypothetical protein
MPLSPRITWRNGVTSMTGPLPVTAARLRMRRGGRGPAIVTRVVASRNSTLRQATANEPRCWAPGTAQARRGGRKPVNEYESWRVEQAVGIPPDRSLS